MNKVEREGSPRKGRNVVRGNQSPTKEKSVSPRKTIPITNGSRGTSPSRKKRDSTILNAQTPNSQGNMKHKIITNDMANKWRSRQNSYMAIFELVKPVAGNTRFCSVPPAPIRKLSEIENANREKAVVVIQSISRCYLARRTFIIQIMAVVIIQARWKCYKMSKMYKTMMKSSMVIQTAMKAYYARQTFLDTKRNILRLQKVCRSILFLRRVAERRAAAQRIQATFRACAARTRMIRAMEATKLLQEVFRICQSRRLVVARLRAAIKIQSVWKGYCVRKKLPSKRNTWFKLRLKHGVLS